MICSYCLSTTASLYLLIIRYLPYSFFFFFNDTATTEIYTLSLHDALPICVAPSNRQHLVRAKFLSQNRYGGCAGQDRKSTRLNSSHSQISYAVFCLKKKKKKKHKMNNIQA